MLQVYPVHPLDRPRPGASKQLVLARYLQTKYYYYYYLQSESSVRDPGEVRDAARSAATPPVYASWFLMSWRFSP